MVATSCDSWAGSEGQTQPGYPCFDAPALTLSAHAVLLTVALQGIDVSISDGTEVQLIYACAGIAVPADYVPAATVEAAAAAEETLNGLRPITADPSVDRVWALSSRPEAIKKIWCARLLQLPAAACTCAKQLQHGAPVQFTGATKMASAAIITAASYAHLPSWLGTWLYHGSAPDQLPVTLWRLHTGGGDHSAV